MTGGGGTHGGGTVLRASARTIAAWRADSSLRTAAHFVFAHATSFVVLTPFFRWLPLALLTLAAFWLRTHDLARRPMHADEANQAVKLGELLDAGRYAFDPRDHHGPTL